MTTGGSADPQPDLDLDDLKQAELRLTRTVDALRGDDWAAPSLLPDWTRAHVVAHLALNGEALRDVLRGEVDHDRVPMYESQERRDADIAELAAAEPSELRERLLGTLTTFTEAVLAVPEETWERRFARTRGAEPTLPLRAVPVMRMREIEIHHADLGLDYTPDDWTQPFAELVVEGMVKRLDPDAGFRVAPLDTPRSWDVDGVGDDPLVVTGPVRHVAWWLTGREPSPQVTSSRGALPTIGGW
jgi:maleylpyruvate isomerase